jgi:hypothetical protein
MLACRSLTNMKEINRMYTEYESLNFIASSWIENAMSTPLLENKAEYLENKQLLKQMNDIKNNLIKLLSHNKEQLLDQVTKRLELLVTNFKSYKKSKHEKAPDEVSV